jgi:hypothetical protein
MLYFDPSHQQAAVTLFSASTLTLQTLKTLSRKAVREMFISWTCEEIDIRSLVRHHLDQPALPIVW